MAGVSAQGRPLAMTDRPAIEAALPAGAFHPAEHGFANLWLFRERHRYRWCDRPVPHLRGITYDGMDHALPLVALTRHDADTLLGSGVACLYPIGDDGAALARRWGLAVRSDPADSDYWYRADALAVLADARARRQQAAGFAATGAVAVAWTPVRRHEALAILGGWAEDVGRPDSDTDLRECGEALALADALGLDGLLAHTATGDAVAFLLAARSGDARIVHFAKARRAYSAALPWLFAQYARSCGAAWLNFEQDLGKPGFAQAKRAYAPARHQPKYRLFPSGA